MHKEQLKRPNAVSSRAVSGNVLIERETLAEFCQNYYIKRLAIFGSALRDDFPPDSDVDVPVEFQLGHVAWTSSPSSATCLAFCKAGAWTWSRRSS